MNQAPLLLIVDDVATNRFLLRNLLQQSNYSVADCSSGKECLSFCERTRPDLILLDVMMPEMDGIETCRALRTRFPKANLPIVMVTSQSEGESLPAALRIGASDFVSKPFDKTVLLSRVQNHLEILAAHRLQEQALRVQRAMGDAFSHPVLLADREGNILYANSYVSADWIQGGIRELITKFDEPSMRELFQEALRFEVKRHQDEFDREISITSGVQKHLHLITRPVKFDGGSELRLWLWRDRTHERDLERRMNERVRLDMVSLFVGGVAHNFNNLLGSIAGAVEMLEKTTPPTDKTKRLIEIIRKGTESATRFTRKMNVFSRPDAVEGYTGDESLHELLETLAVTYGCGVEDRITFNVSADGHLPKVAMKLGHLSEVLSNVMQNAVEAIQAPKRGTITVNASAVPNSSHLVLTITDTGVGMERAVLERMFEPFFSTKNLDLRNSVSMKGNGLGLWNVYNLMRLAGGDVSVESDLGVGTTVTLLLPIKRA